MFEYKELRKRIFYKGVELASFYAEYPFFFDLQFATDLYEGYAQRCFDWFCEKYYPKILEEYIADTDPRKRFDTLARRYEIKFGVGYFDGELLSIKCEMKLRRGRKEVTAEYRGSQNFDPSQRILISPKSALKRVCRRVPRSKLSSLKEKPIYIDKSKRIFYFDGTEWKNIIIENQ